MHGVCANLENKEVRRILKNDSSWYCSLCLHAIPFQNITDQELRFLNTEHNMEPTLFNLFEQCSDLNFKPFDITEYNCCDFETNIDPNNNFYNNIRTPCKYYTEDQFAALKKGKSGISFIHFNARGLRTNFSKIENLLN